MNTNKLFIHKYNKFSYLIMTYFTGSTICSVVMKFVATARLNQLSQTHLAQN